MSIKYLPRTPRLPTSLEDVGSFIKALYNILLETGMAVNAILDSLQAATWMTPTFLNGWVDYATGGPVGYMLDASGFVHLKGTAKNGAAAAMFVLPAGYCPTQHFYAVGMSTSNTACRIDISTDGTVSWVGGGANTFVSLDGITFKAAM